LRRLRRAKWGVGAAQPRAAIENRSDEVNLDRTYAVAVFCITTPHFACGGKVHTDLFVCGFAALRAVKPHTLEKKYRSAEGTMRQLCKPY